MLSGVSVSAHLLSIGSWVRISIVGFISKLYTFWKSKLHFEDKICNVLNYSAFPDIWKVIMHSVSFIQNAFKISPAPDHLLTNLWITSIHLKREIWTIPFNSKPLCSPFSLVSLKDTHGDDNYLPINFMHIFLLNSKFYLRCKHYIEHRNAQHSTFVC